MLHLNVFPDYSFPLKLPNACTHMFTHNNGETHTHIIRKFTFSVFVCHTYVYTTHTLFALTARQSSCSVQELSPEQIACGGRQVFPVVSHWPLLHLSL